MSVVFFYPDLGVNGSYSTLIKDKRSSQILQLIQRVEQSGLSANQYFATHSTPISVIQYYRLKKRYEQQGVAGLEDQRHLGNARKLTPEQVELTRGVLAYNRALSSRAVQEELHQQWGIDVGLRRIEQYRQEFDLPRLRPKSVSEEAVSFAGIEIFAALAHHVGILECWNETIRQRMQQVQPDGSDTEDHRGKGDPLYARRRNGTFSPRYNRLARVRRMKFASISDKIENKDLSRLSLFQTQAATLDRKNLALLLLPLVTHNGAVRNLDTPLGNALEQACGYNYKHATIDKYLRELKYLQVSTQLIDCNAQFWSRFWKPYDASDPKVMCYYIDGNVKPLWSSKRCRKGKVSMLGRVMGCLEQVVIHDGYGHPLYVRTFSGHADLQKYALKSMEELDNLLSEESSSRSQKSPCSRALIMDSAANAVHTLRAFSKSDYYYITLLDTNQIHPRKIKHLSPSQRYRYGEATLTESRIELIDSKQRDYIYESRAVQVHWDNGRECCLVSSIPKTIFDASEVVKAYFDRWPCCEKQYALMKSALCFFQVVGYGKKPVADENKIAQIEKLQTDLQHLQEELETPLSQITVQEQQLQTLFEQERSLKEKSQIKEGKRRQSHLDQETLERCQRDIRKIQRDIKKIEKPFQKSFSSLRQKSKEFSRIQGKREVYHVDVELDQLVTSFRLTLANLLAFLAKEILEDTPMEMNSLIQSILFLSGRIEHHPDRRKVYLNPNKKDPSFMAKLAKGLSKLNTLNIQHPSGVGYEFHFG